MTLKESQIQRYSRQIILREVGGSGQEKLAAATVLVVGAGALASPLASYLVCAGVGHVILMDGDRVELSNLQRQFLHTTGRLGWPKAASAVAALGEINPEVRLTAVEERLTADNADHWLGQCDIVADATDNFTTRYLLNQVAYRLAKPLVYGAVLGFDGQLSLFRHGVDRQAPCYQCLYPLPPDPATAPTCATAGVMGALPGMIGSLQALEVIKSLLGVGEGLSGSLLLVSGLYGLFHTVRIAKDATCATCSQPAR